MKKQKRRRGDLNPRAGTTDLLVFEARPFSHLGTPPEENMIRSMPFVKAISEFSCCLTANCKHYNKEFSICKGKFFLSFPIFYNMQYYSTKNSCCQRQQRHLAQKAIGKLAFHNAFLCKVFTSHRDVNFLVL